MTTADTGSLELRYFGSIDALDTGTTRALFDRTTSVDPEVRRRTSEIIDDVRVRGDVALRELALQFDGVSLRELEVPRERWRAALDRTEPSVRRAMERAARNIESVHRAFLPTATEVLPEPGIVVGRRPDPLVRVGIYAPGGRAAYPSSVLMGVVPARVAGVGEIVVASPPVADDTPSQAVLAAAELAGAHRVFAIGGAGAIAALAFGTRSVPRVDRVAGPGNAYVAEAKLQVAGVVSIDAPAGPSELLVLADAGARVDVVCREALAQAEHDPRACVVVIAVGEPMAQRVRDSLARELKLEPRREIIATSLAGQGAILWAGSLEQALAWSNAYAPEHLMLCLTDADAILPRVRNAGTVFVGERASVAFGDYMTGANHVLPTGGLARSYSGLSTLEFLRWTTYQRVEANAAKSLASDVDEFARAEGLPAHARAAASWGGSPA